MLTFYKKFIPAILSGQKTQTLRAWKYPRFRAGQRSYIPGVGYIQIMEVVCVPTESLSDSDAILDGFPDVEALKEELQHIYGENLPQQFYRIRFRVYGAEDQKRIKAEQREKKKLKLANKVKIDRAISSDISVQTKKKQNLSETQETEDETELYPTKLSERVLEGKSDSGILTAEEVAYKILLKCRVHSNICDWNHEPGRTQDFFALFLRSPRSTSGIPNLDGARLYTLVNDLLEEPEKERLRWLVHSVCKAWGEWQYAVELFLKYHDKETGI